MKRKRPPRLIESAPFVAGTATPLHPPVWQHGDELPGASAMGLGSVVFLLVLLFILPFYGLALAFISAVEAVKGLPLSFVENLSEPMLIIPMLLTALMAACMIGWLASASRVLAFSFDETSQMFTFTEGRRARKPREVQVPFSDIHSVAPYITTSYDRSGHFEVAFSDSRGKLIHHRMGWNMPLEEMEFHAAWLRGLIGERMYELTRLDL